MILVDPLVQKVEIDLANLDTSDQGDMFEELLEVTPDKELAERFIKSASPELEEMLKEHFMSTYGLVEAEDQPEEPKSA